MKSDVIKNLSVACCVLLLHGTSLAQGKFQWVKNPISFGSEAGYAVYADDFGFVYAVGKYDDTLVFANQTFISQSGSVGYDGIILKFDSMGNEIWAKTISSFQSQATNYCVGIDGDSQG